MAVTLLKARLCSAWLMLVVSNQLAACKVSNEHIPSCGLLATIDQGILLIR